MMSGEKKNFWQMVMVHRKNSIRVVAILVFLGSILFPMQGHCAETVARNVAESDTVTYNEPLLDRENVRQKDVVGTEEEEEETGIIDQNIVWDIFSLEKATNQILQKCDGSRGDAASFPARQVFTLLMQGQLEEIYTLLKQYVVTLLSGQWGGLRKMLIGVLMIGIGSGAGVLLGELYPNGNLGKTVGYVTFLLMLVLLLSEYGNMSELAIQTMGQIAEFIPLFVPAFVASIGVACGLHTASGYQALLMGLSYLVVRFLVAILLPLVYAYLLLAIMDGLWQEDRLDGMLCLVKKTVETSLRLVTRVVAGIGLVQAMILPVLDSLQGMAVRKMIAILPGIGNLSDQVFKMFVGSCVLIKNCIGIYFALLLLCICFVPLLRLFLFMISLKCLAAMVAVVGERNLVKCMGRIGDSCLLLMKILTAVITMLFLLISTACYLRGYQY